MSNRITDDVVESLRMAARKITGFRRRQFQAEMALKYCDGSSRKAETMFGWQRDAVNTGLNELRTGMRCVDNVRARGRKKTEQVYPQLEQRIRQIVEPHSQVDPKFQTTLVYTRITAARVRAELQQDDELKAVVPSRQTVGEILNRLGYCLRNHGLFVLNVSLDNQCRVFVAAFWRNTLCVRRVQKVRPQNKSPKQTPSSPTSMRRERGLLRNQTR